MNFEHIAILGPGVLGGSIARGLRHRELGESVRLWARREEVVREVEKAALVDCVTGDLSEAVEGADLVILATPVGVMPSLVDRLVEAEALSAGAVVTDIGSVKAPVVRQLEPRLEPTWAFVGSHPMAGSEKTGFAHATPTLLENAFCLLTPSPESRPEAVDRVDAFWVALGMRTARLAPEAHDAAVARISHLPHLLASLLVLSALDPDPNAARFSGGGLRDSTRIAAGPPDMWTEILLENRTALIEAVQDLHGRLGESLAFLENLDEEALRRLLERAKNRRDSLGSSAPS